MARSNNLFIISATLAILHGSCFGTVLPNGGVNLRAEISEPLEIEGLIYLGKTATKELYISDNRKLTFQVALGFGCSYMAGLEYNLTLAAIQTLEEVALLDTYFANTQSQDDPAELVWTSGVARLGKIKDQWASTGEEMTCPTSCQGNWMPGQGSSPGVADWNCVGIWRYCDKQGHGATIPRCDRAPYGTWMTVVPCAQQYRYLCERRF